MFVFLGGRLLEKIRIPWIFSALIIGTLIAIRNPFSEITSSPIFLFLAQLGMYFLLFIIGFEIDLKELETKSRFIFKSTFFIIFLEVFFGSLIVHFIFGYSWIIAFLVAMSFATVGEAILIPILEEFKIVNTNLGQTIIGIGTFDDLIEIFALILAVVLITQGVQSRTEVYIILASLALLFIFTMTLTKLKENGIKFRFHSIETLFLFTTFIFFLFIGVGLYAESAPLAALLAGIGLKTFIPNKRLRNIESEIKTMCYGLFAPIFFLWVGITIDVSYLLTAPLLILLVVGVSTGAKILGSYLMGRKELGLKKSIVLGIGLSVRFSTGIVIITLLFNKGIINAELYSVIIASTIVFTFMVPFLFSKLILRWGLSKK